MNIKLEPERDSVSFNYTGEVLSAISRSDLIRTVFYGDEITPMHLFLALTLEKTSSIHEFLRELGMQLETTDSINYIVNTPICFEKITGRDYPFGSDEVDSEDCEASEDSEGKNEDEETETKDENNSSSNSTPPNISINIMPTDSPDSDEQKTLSALINIVNSVRHHIVVDEDEDLTIFYSEECEDILCKAGKACLKGKQNCIDANNLMYQLLISDNEELNNLFDVWKFKKEEYAEYLLSNANIFEDSDEGNGLSLPRSLQNCCMILNNKYTKGTVCDILGRDSEVKHLWNIFSKKTKRNAILVGEPGCGKSAIIEALTIQIVNETCPTEFLGYSVIELNVTGMVAGTKYRGEFEQKITALTSFLETTDKVILFVDEIHEMMGTGSTEGSLDLSGSLKPILARDNAIFVGATTTKEYNEILSRDGAFKRRFEIIDVNEPHINELKPMIQKRIETLSNHHKVQVPEDVLDFVIISAYAFNSTTSNPDKTIDLLDRSLAAAKMQNCNTLSIEHVKSIFEENYEIYNHQSEHYNTSIAYHEAGHYILLRLNEAILHEEVILVSIIPTRETSGVNIYEHSKYDYSLPTKEYYYASIASDLAGRIAENFYTKTIDAGASSDLRKANEKIENMISLYGMDNDYLNTTIAYCHTNDAKISDKMLDCILEKKKAILLDIEKKTEKILMDNIDKLKNVVNLLLEKKIATAEELDKAFNM